MYLIFLGTGPPHPIKSSSDPPLKIPEHSYHPSSDNGLENIFHFCSNRPTPDITVNGPNTKKKTKKKQEKQERKDVVSENVLKKTKSNKNRKKQEKTREIKGVVSENVLYFCFSNFFYYMAVPGK